MKISEEEIEDWVVENVETVCGEPGYRAVGRQVTLPTGRRLDVLAARYSKSLDGYVFVVIEVKAVVVDTSAAHQLATYMSDLSATINAGNDAGNHVVLGALVGPAPTDQVVQLVRWTDSISLHEVEASFAARERVGINATGGYLSFNNAEIERKARSTWRDVFLPAFDQQLRPEPETDTPPSNDSAVA